MRNIVTLFGLLFFVTNALAQTSVDHGVDLEALDKYYSQMVEDWDLPSASIGIVKDGALVFTGNYGVLEKGKVDQPNEHSLYAIASNSKAFTSALIGMLVQEGKLDWNDKVKKYLPYFALYENSWEGNEVTIRDLLSHRVGLGTFSGDLIWFKSNLKAEDIVRRANYLPKAYDFRAGYGYSNLMYLTAGEVIKKVSGKSWEENVRERILEPLQMTRTIATSKDLEKTNNYATPHGREEDQNFPIEWVDWGEIAPMGGLISSVSDLSKWMIFNLNHGISGKDSLLTPQTRNLMWTPHNNFTVDHTTDNDFKRHFSGYALGWGVSDYHGRLRVGHTGGYDGMLSAVTMIPDENLGVVVLTNGMQSPFMAATYYALDRFLGLEKKDWSKEHLENRKSRQKKNTRISSRVEKRLMNTKPSLSLDQYVGTYNSKIYGHIYISHEGDRLKLDFEHSPDLSADLSHWHYDVWKIEWHEKHAWFNFGTIKFNMDNNLKVIGVDFDVPNDDIWFDELKAKKVD